MEFDQSCLMDQYFLFIAEYYSSTWNDLRLFDHSPLERHKGCYHLLATTNKTFSAISICV